jgi:hypothetical protein
MSIKIDKSVFTPDELNTYKALIAKATVDPEAGEDEMEKEMPEEKRRRRRPDIEVEFDDDHFDDDNIEGLDKSNCKKSADPQLAAAMNRLETLEKSIAMKEFSEIAKKYAPLGEDEAELAKTLYDMKKSNEANYNAYIGILDKSLGLVEKSGIFAEIGKSAGGYSVAGGAVEKVEAIAADIMKSDTSISREHAIAKAWEDHPELVAEYDREYRR